MSCIETIQPLLTTLVLVSTDETFLWEDDFRPSTGVSQCDFDFDVWDLVLGTNAAVSMKPAMQFAPVRKERPGTGAAISAGSARTTTGRVHYAETVSAADQLLFRRGVSYRLTAGSYARAQVMLGSAYRSCGRMLAPREFEFQPTNSTADISVFSLGGYFPTVGVDKVKAAVIGIGNLNGDMEHQLAGRAFNDPMERGTWTLLQGASWSTQTSGNFAMNTNEWSIAGLSPSSYMFMELGFAVRKGAANDPNSSVTFRILPAIKYT